MLLDLGLDATTVRRMADRRQDWANIVEHDALRLLIGKVHGSLHDIVGEGVAEKLLKLNLAVDLRDEQTLGLWAGAADAFLDNVGAELLLRQVRDIVLEAATQRLGESWLREIENVLHHIVAERILDERERIGDDVIDQGTLLATGCMVNATLEDAATVTMSSHNNAVVTNGIEDELSIVRTQVVETFLNHMVAVEVLDELHHIVLESGDDQLSLLWARDVFDHSLQRASAVLIEGDLRHGWNGSLDEDCTLLGVGIFEKTLA